MKQLKVMETQGLLKSDSYGLGVEKLWRITASATKESPKKAQLQILKDHGVEEAGKLDPTLYDHEIAHGWVFVSFLLCGEVRRWSRKADPFLKDDSYFEIGSSCLPYYLEIEMGKHSIERIEEKINRYVKHYRETKQPQHLLFVEMTEQKVEERLEMFERLRLTQHYQVALFVDILKGPLIAKISHRLDTFTFSEKLLLPLPNTFQSPSNSLEGSTAQT